MSNTKSRTPVVILGMDAAGLSAARSLGRRGIPVTGVDFTADQPGMKSRYLKVRRVAPPAADDERLMSFLLELGRSFEERPLLFPATDQFLEVVFRHRLELASCYRFHLPAAECAEIFFDRQEIMSRVQRYDVACPGSYAVDPADLGRDLTERIKFPCVVRPRYLQDSREDNSVPARTAAELTAAIAAAGRDGRELIVQEIVPGPERNGYVYLAYVHETGDILASCCLRTLRRHPALTGDASLTESIVEPTVIELAQNLIRDLEITGMVCLEFKLHEDTRRPYFIEGRLRLSGTGELAAAAGVDFPYIVYHHLIEHGEILPGLDFQDGVKLVNFDLDLGHLARTLRSREMPFWQWMGAYRASKMACTWLCWDDPWPWLLVYGRRIRWITISAFGKIFSAQSWRWLSGWFRDPRKFIKAEKKTAPRTAVRSKPFKGKLKILHLISSGGLYGAENVVLTLSRRLSAEGMDIVVGAMADSRRPQLDILDKAAEAGLPVYTLPCQGRLDIFAVLRLKKYLKDNAISLLHTHNYKSNLIGLLAAKIAGIPVVATAHGYTDMSPAVSLYEALDRVVLKSFFDAVVGVNQLIVRQIPAGRRHVIPNGIETDQFKSSADARRKIRERYRIQLDEVVIGCVGRLSKEKNQILLLKAMYRLIRQNRRIKLLLIGDGPQRAQLEHFISVRHLAQYCELTGVIRDLSPYYAAMDVFVLPSLTEGVPLTLLEAMAAGVPVIASAVGGIPDIVADKQNGLLINPEVPESLVDRLKYLIGKKDLRRELASNALEFVQKKYSVDGMVQGYRKFYNQVSGGGAPAQNPAELPSTQDRDHPLPSSHGAVS